MSTCNESVKLHSSCSSTWYHRLVMLRDCSMSWSNSLDVYIPCLTFCCSHMKNLTALYRHSCDVMVLFKGKLSNSYTMGCPPVRGDNPRALASGLSYVQVDKHGITNLYHLHQCRPCTSRDISC